MARAQIVLTYCLFVTIWFLVRLVWPDEWWPFVLLNKLALYFLLAAMPVLLLALTTRRTKVIFAAIVPFLIFLYFYSLYLLPRKTPTLLEPDIRVLTYNIWNQNRDLQSVVNLIIDIGADVVAVQEVMEGAKFQLVRGLEQSYPYSHISQPVYGGTTALFSKQPLHDVVEIDFEIDRPAIVANILVHGKKLTVASAHLNPSFYAYNDRPFGEIPRAIEKYIADQNAQASMLIDKLDELEAENIVFACDCNTQATASTYEILQRYFDDSAKALGWQIGPNTGDIGKFERNIGHIDYVWFKGDLEPVAVYRSRAAGGSDHNPVFADFQL